jgi:hypothetical protein
MTNLQYLIQTAEAPDRGIAKLTQGAHDLLAKIMPEWYEGVRHTPGGIMLEGFVGGYLATWALQGISKHVMPEKFDKYALPFLERLCQIGIPMGAIVWGITDPEGAKQWYYNYPLDTMGLVMAYIAGSARAQQDLSKREIKPLDDFVKKQWRITKEQWKKRWAKLKPK